MDQDININRQWQNKLTYQEYRNGHKISIHCYKSTAGAIVQKFDSSENTRINKKYVNYLIS